MTANVIELDTTVPWEPPSPPPRHGGLPRWLIAALGVMVLLVTPLSATRSDRSHAALLRLTARDAVLFVGGDTVYEVPVGSAQGRSIRAYALPSGRLRWEKMIPAEDGGSYWHMYGDVLFEAVPSPGADGRLQPGVLRAVDPATGDARWERKGVDIWLANSKVALLVEVVSQDALGIPRIVAVYGVDPVSGREIWSRRLTGPFAFSWHSVELADSWDFPRRLPLAGRPPVDGLALAELSPTAELRMTDLSTGVTDPPVQLALSSVPTYFEIVDGVLSFQTGGDLIAYDVDANQLLSRLPMSNARFPCGRLYLCAATIEDTASGVQVFDRRTGARLVTLPRSRVAGMIGDRLLLRNDSQSVVRTTTVIDLAGDRVPRSFAPWGSPVQFDDHRVIVSTHSLKDGAATVVVLALGTGRAVVVGEARKLFVAPECRRFGDYVVCASPPYHLVWRIPAELRSSSR
jgi:hypothetical protein